MKRRILPAMMVGVAVLMMAMVPQARAAEAPPKPAPQVADGAWADALKVHPRVFGPKSFLQQMAKTKAGAYAEIKSEAAATKHGASKRGELGPAKLMAIGIVATVDGVSKAEADPYIKDAMDEVAKGPTNKHQFTWEAMEYVARTFDLFYEHISPADRAKMIAYLNAELVTFKIDEGAFHNSTMSKINAYLEVAYATWGDNPKAAEFRNYALKGLYEGRIVPVLKEYGDGGGYTECGWYTRGCLWNLVQGLELARRFEKYDGFAKAPAFFYDRMAYEMLQPYPAMEKAWNCEQYSCEGDGSNLYSIAQEYPRLTRNLLASYWRGSPLAGYMALTNRKGSNSGTRIFDFLWEEKMDKQADLKPFPLAHAALPIGKVYARGDWTQDATWLRFECGDPFTQHQHLEAGNFEIFRRQPLAMESGEYNDDWSSAHAVNWMIRTVAHNCILVYMPGEKFNCSRAQGAGTMANDGGQLENIRYSEDLATWKQNLGTNDHGNIAAYDNQAEFMYVAGDCTKAYNRAKVSAVMRQIVFIRPNTFVIYDRVNSTRADYEKTWLMHCMNEPKIEGSIFEVKDGKGKLSGQTLLPEKAKVTSVHGYTYRGKTYEAQEGGSQNSTAVKWRVEVTPTVAATQDVFLHVLQTEDKPAIATLVKKNGSVGASAGNWEVLFDSGMGGTVTINGKATAFKGVVKPGEYE